LVYIVHVFFFCCGVCGVGGWRRSEVYNGRMEKKGDDGLGLVEVIRKLEKQRDAEYGLDK